MSKQWNQVNSGTREPKLLEVMSEELMKRKQIEEDFVWIEMAETDHQAELCESSPFEVNTENKTSSDINSYDISIAVHLSIDYEGSGEELSDQDLPEDEVLLEAEYVNQCIKNKVKPFNPLRLNYRKPYMLKIRERGVYSIQKRQICCEQNNKKNSEQTNNLLPKMKFDASTTAVLEMSITNRYLGQFNELIYTGKNCVVFHAYCNRKNCITMPFENVVKIYRTSKDKDRNKIIYKQVQRELEHLNIIWKQSYKIIGMHQCPMPVKAWKNVIVMGVIGRRETVSITIEDCPPEKDEAMYKSIIDFIDKCYNILNLVHGKLSARKILCWPDRPNFIGWSQSVKTSHPMALSKLMKDCHFVTKFYKERGVAVKSAIDLFKQISGQEIIDKKLLEIIEGSDLYGKYQTTNIRTNPVKSTTNKRFK